MDFVTNTAARCAFDKRLNNLAAAVIGGTTPLLLAMLVQANSGWAAWYPSLFCIVAVISAFLLHRYRKPINPYAV